MSDNEIKNFAIKHGFVDAKKLGVLDECEIYQPVFADKKTRMVGYPQYIVIDKEKVSLKIDTDFKITDHFFKDK